MGRQLAHQTRLPNTRLAADQQRLALASQRLTPNGLGLLQFALPRNKTTAHDAGDDRELFLCLSLWIEQIRIVQQLEQRGCRCRSILWIFVQ